MKQGENVHFIFNAGNPKKVTAIINVLEKVPGFFSFDKVILESKDYRPLTFHEIDDANKEQLSNLFRTYKCRSLERKNLYAINLQKGTNLADEKEPPQFICLASIIAEDSSKISLAENRVSLPEEVRSLVIDKGMPLYDAYGEVFGEDVKNKKVSLYEHLTGRSEQGWFEETLFKAFFY